MPAAEVAALSVVKLGGCATTNAAARPQRFTASLPSRAERALEFTAARVAADGHLQPLAVWTRGKFESSGGKAAVAAAGELAG